MRSSRESRTTVRTASAAKSAPVSNASPVRRTPENAVLVEENPVLVEEDGVYESSCGRTSCCADPCGRPCDLFGSGLWVELDFLLWWRDRRDFPAGHDPAERRCRSRSDGLVWRAGRRASPARRASGGRPVARSLSADCDRGALPARSPTRRFHRNGVPTNCPLSLDRSRMSRRIPQR